MHSWKYGAVNTGSGSIRTCCLIFFGLFDVNLARSSIEIFYRYAKESNDFEGSNYCTGIYLIELSRQDVNHILREFRIQTMACFHFICVKLKENSTEDNFY